jgi:hypothetical protein
MKVVLHQISNQLKKPLDYILEAINSVGLKTNDDILNIFRMLLQLEFFANGKNIILKGEKINLFSF